MDSENTLSRLAQAWADHGRHFEQYEFVYPVVSRRAGGISLGINLSPNLLCNFDCPYCQVDRSTPPESLPIFTFSKLQGELERALGHWLNNRFTDSPRFQGLSESQLDLKDMCLSGDGEPTMVAEFPEVCELLAELQAMLTRHPLKLVLITNATLLHQPKVREGLRFLTMAQGEIWGKLDAGTETWFQKLSRSRYTIDHIEKNLTMTVREFPLRIQTMLCSVQGEKPSPEELSAYAERLRRIYAANPENLLEVQLYTVVRRTSSDMVEPLPGSFLEETATWLRTQIPTRIEAYWDK